MAGDAPDASLTRAASSALCFPSSGQVSSLPFPTLSVLSCSRWSPLQGRGLVSMDLAGLPWPPAPSLPPTVLKHISTSFSLPGAPAGWAQLPLDTHCVCFLPGPPSPSTATRSN